LGATGLSGAAAGAADVSVGGVVAEAGFGGKVRASRGTAGTDGFSAAGGAALAFATVAAFALPFAAAGFAGAFAAAFATVLFAVVLVAVFVEAFALAGRRGVFAALRAGALVLAFFMMD